MNRFIPTAKLFPCVWMDRKGGTFWVTLGYARGDDWLQDPAGTLGFAAIGGDRHHGLQRFPTSFSFLIPPLTTLLTKPPRVSGS